MKSVLLTAILVLFSGNFEAQAKSFEVLNPKIEQGSVLIVRIVPQWQAKAVFNPAISVFGKHYLPNKYGEVFVGVDPEEKPGKYATTLVEYGRGVRLDWDYEKIEVLDRKFPISRVSRNMGTIDTVRYKKDRDRINKAYQLANRHENYANGRFVNPFDTVTVTDEFYTKRIFLDGTSIHRGTDLKAAVGTSVYATNSGTVILADRDFLLEGNMVIIDHGSGILSYYLHLSRINVHEGQFVKKGEAIALSGDTGLGVRYPHLHFAIKVGGISVDPLRFIETMNQYINR
ncbi:MAG: hypothetical protein A3J46_03140 [Candidatus Yanofskybacteria bacterium RIFCSPHIGHO2_02_FULL_41_11]|uniref:M23ase beta-sheet core domain-containing protein n=1 Tax=Candidatus Yanofskybacteria bacterium RIFCSPHIGHO2_02_FULL_41_11 TaxID=1802675 RepID=A0A1F8F8H2_9BACT|nr:MAG: hypothetical protein A3J46_03140 [Candidatus Yanofskybacteria bacterium RIFCSPHIGHO2_02_FULL_41_11]